MKSGGFLASGLYACGFSALCAALPRGLVGEKFTELIEQTFNREGSLYLACNDKNAFFLRRLRRRSIIILNLNFMQIFANQKYS